jgi:hypothetical protein
MNVMTLENLTELHSIPLQRVAQHHTARALDGRENANESPLDRANEVRRAFTEFVGQTFYTQMIKAMRSTQGKPAYFHGGRAEEVFRVQLDQTFAEKMTDATAKQFVEPIFEHQFPQYASLLREAS